MVYSIYVEKKPGLSPEASSLLADLKNFLGIENLTDVRANEWYCGYVHSLVDTPVQNAINSRYVASANNTTVAPINVAAYNHNVDLLNVYINGFRLMPGVEYTINPATASITLAEPIDAGTVVDFEAIMPRMPEEGVPDLAEVVADLAQAVTTLQADVEALEADTGWIEIPWESGATSNVNWTARLRRVGKSIFLRGLCTSVTANEIQLATIPSGYRPTMGGHSYTGFCSNSSGGNTRAARMFIETNGAVVFRSAGNAAPSSGDVINISTSWLID